MNLRIHIFSLAIVLSLAVGCTGEGEQFSTGSAEALRVYKEGVSQSQLFHFVEARASFEHSIAQDSGFALAWARIAILDFTAQNESASRLEIARALKLSAGATKKEQLFVRMWERRINFAREEAEAVVDSMIILFPHEPEAYVFKGTLLEEKKNLDEAIRLYQRALEVDSAYAPAVMMLGYAYSTANEQEKAVASMQRYIRLAPHAADPRASYADLLLRVGRYDEALEQYKHALDLKPDYWYSFQQIAAIYAMLGRLNDAELFLNKAFKLMPFSTQLEASQMSGLAGFNVQRGRHAEALRMYAEALALDSTNLSAQYGYVYALTKLQRHSEAEEMLGHIFRELARRNLSESQAMLGFYLTRSRLLTDEGKLDAALLECDTALQFSAPLTRPAVYRQLGEIYARMRMFEDALDACEEALSLNSNSPPALLTLTRVYANMGDVRMTQEIGNRLHMLWSNADQDFQDALELKRLLAGKRPRGA